MKMSEPKKKIRYSGCFTKIAIVVITAIVVLLLQGVPAWLSGKLLPALAESAGVAGLEANVTSFGFSGAELRNARIRIEGRRSVSANTIRVRYQLPFYPFRRNIRIRRLEITGLRINVIGEDGRWSVPGIYPELLKKTGSAEPESSRETTDSASSVHLEQLILNDCEIRIEQAGRVLSIPFTARIQMPSETDKPWRARAGVQFNGDRFDFRAAWNRENGDFTVGGQSELRLTNYTGVLPALQGKIFGSTAFQTEISGRLGKGGWPEAMKGSLIFNELSIGSRAFRIGMVDGKKFTLQFVQRTPECFDWTLDGIELERPVRTELTASGGELTVGKEEWTVNGRLGTLIRRQGALTRDLPLAHDFKFSWNLPQRTGSWTYRSALAECGWENMLNSSFGKVELNSSGTINEGVVRSKNELTVAPELTVNRAGQTVRVAAPTVNSEVVYGPGGVSGRIELTAKKITLPGFQAETGPLSMKIPLGKGEKGVLELDAITVRGYKLDALSYTIRNSGTALELDGELKQDILPALRCSNRTTVGWTPALNITAELNIATGGDGSKSMALEKLTPSLKGMTLEGELAFRGTYQWSPADHGGACGIELRNGTLRSVPLRLQASGLNFKVDLPDLPLLETDPMQKLSCKELKVRGFVFNNIEAEFLLDNRRAFVLESLGLDWCGGSVFTYSLAFAPGDRNVQATLYFDGLNISQIIAQSGLTAAEGDGTIFGRMPLTVGRDGIVLRPGFFYSVPGETRNIRFADLKNMLAAIPPGSPQYNKLDLAVEALKDFNYDWIRVDFRNEGDKLVLASRFNGRPANLLPFTYDDKTGGLVRREGARANFQGIMLELNSSLPLNQLLKFNTQMQKLFGGKK